MIFKFFYFINRKEVNRYGFFVIVGILEIFLGGRRNRSYFFEKLFGINVISWRFLVIELFLVY